MKHKFFILGIVIIMAALACTKEDPIKPYADFTTSLVNNTVNRNQAFVVYLDNVQGEFLTYFSGRTLQNTYDSDIPSRTGTSFSNELDSVEVRGYNFPRDTTIVFTLVASSSGNWAEDYVQDVKQININVVVPK